jgi:hypothetical protein
MEHVQIIKINTRGNGSCPLCRKRKDCAIIKYIETLLKDGLYVDDLEMVIYKCSKFDEDTTGD